MNKYCIEMLSIIQKYEESRRLGIGIQTLDRKFYEVFDYEEARISETIKILKEMNMLSDDYPYKVSSNGRRFLLDHEKNLTNKKHENNLDKYHYLLLKIISEYDEGKGIGIPTLDRMFYEEILKEKQSIEDLYDVQWIPRIKELSKQEFICKTPSGKGEMITDKGRQFLLDAHH